MFAVLQAVGISPESTIPVGHSLGGSVCQVVASQELVRQAGYPSETFFPGVVLLASVCHEFWLSFYVPLLLSLWLKTPRLAWRVQHDGSQLFSSQALAKRFLFQPSTPMAVVDSCYRALCREAGASAEVVKAKTAPLAAAQVLFIGGWRDALVPPAKILQSAQQYERLGTTAECRFFAAPHDLMLDGPIDDVIAAMASFARGCAA